MRFDTLVRLTICLTALALLSCGGADVVRPDSFTAGESIGEAFACTPEKLRGDLSPFTVDWSDGDRAALESAMNRGVAVVKMTCEGPEILKACTVLGDYAYNGISKKTKLVKMKDMGAVAANFGGVVSGAASFVSELAQGRSLNLAYVLVGVSSTTVPFVEPKHLKGRCEGATHFVFEAQHGAFAMDTAEAGSALAAADVLGIASASAEASSEKSTRTTDGDPDSCEGASQSDRELTEGCSALMRVELMAVSGEGEAPKSAELTGAVAKQVVGCPDGFVFASDGACQRPEDVEARMCTPGDLIECSEQCELGSLESCEQRAMDHLFDYELTLWQEELSITDPDMFDPIPVGWRETWSAGIPEMDRIGEACLEGFASSCGVIALTEYGSNILEDEWIDLAGEACALGEPLSCVELRQHLGLLSGEEKFEEIMTSACLRGSGYGCHLRMLVAAGGFDTLEALEGFNADDDVADWASLACFGGRSGACLFAAAIHDDNNCEPLLNGAVLDPVAGYIEGVDIPMLCTGVAPGVPDDQFSARLYLEAGCDAGNPSACDYITRFYPDLDLDLNLDDLDLDLSDEELENLDL